METLKVPIRRKPGALDLPIPSYATPGSSGVDLYADVDKEVILSPGETGLISCGIYMSIPEGFEAQIRPRSGLALKYGITMLNTPGTIDSDYRGLISVIAINHGKEAFTVKRGLRLAQMVFQKVARAEFIEAENLDGTARSDGGFGHTGFN
ncbi:MAG: dUTP diphosphatase [Candidatus Omnitrophica bacterium]|nr:dUTP diphosphatase [Candidatus Omnitrophota bacterium]